MDEELKKRISKTNKWVIQGGAAVPHLNAFALLAITKRLDEIVPGFGFDPYMTFFQKKGDLVNWVFDEELTLSLGAELEKNPKILEKTFTEWEKEEYSFYAEIELLEKEGIKDILEDYLAFGKKYVDAFASSLLTEYFTLQSDIIAERVFAKIPKEYKALANKIIAPCGKPFLSEEQESALKIGLMLKEISEKEKIRMKRIGADFLGKKYPEIFELLERHCKNFFWIRNNYKDTKPISNEEFLENISESVEMLSKEQVREKISELEKYEEQHEKDVKEVTSKLEISSEDFGLLLLVSKIGFWHDKRKKTNLIANHWLNEFLQKASEKTKTPFEELQFTLPVEFQKIIETKAIDKKVIAERMNGCLHAMFKDGKEWIITGKEFVELKKTILEKNSLGEIHDFRGMPASYGTATGFAKVVLNPKKAVFNQGDILVAPMTRPDYVPLMKKAAAIVTDEGGVTSHAAIIAREFGIPCIVGTKIATKVLKDGDLIEVRANHGLVRKIG